MSETPDETPDETTPAPVVWRPYGYADPRTGTTEAAGAAARPGPVTETPGGIVPDAGAGSSASWAARIGAADADDVDAVPLPAAPGADVAAAELPAVLVPDNEATRAAESHPNVAVPSDATGSGDSGGAGPATDVESGEPLAGATVDDGSGAAALVETAEAPTEAAPVDVEGSGAAAPVEDTAATPAGLVDVEPGAGQTGDVDDVGAAAVLPPTVEDGADVVDSAPEESPGA